MATVKAIFAAFMSATGGEKGVGAPFYPGAAGLECAMPGPRILFVKLSSLGDVIHHLPAVTDVAERYPGARISWAIEEAYVDIARLHPAVTETIAVGLRGVRRHPLAPGRWRSVAQARRTLR
ncbi:MAG TPA: hypothetical protein VH301_17855, partial [Usitatibacter sp.]|nr:hypothetical protein [Usitatibacter sp.]